MDVIDNIQQILDMVGGSISDVSSCDEDFENIDDDFVRRYPNYTKPGISEEYKTMLENIKKDFILFRKRTYVKTVFQYVEGILFAMKRIILEHIDDLKDSEIIRLQEFKMVGLSIDKLKEEPVWLSLEENIKFTFNRYGKVRAQNYQTRFDCAEWDIFKECIKIRNRITHPKHSSEMIITDEDVIKVKASYDWFFKILNELQQHEVY
jgi:hypothetical protein